MFRILAFGLLIYAVWKLLSSLFSPHKPNPNDSPTPPNQNQSNRNNDDEGFTPYEEVE